MADSNKQAGKNAGSGRQINRACGGRKDARRDIQKGERSR